MANLTKTLSWPDHVSESQVRKARIATFFGFFQLGALILMWSTSTSPLRTHFGWEGAAGDQSFGYLALAIGIGAAAGAFIIGPFLDKFGPRKTLGLTMIAGPLLYIPLGLVGGVAAPLLFGVMIGLLRGAQDTAVNTHGIQVERYYGRSIMSLFHAAYPVGGFVFGMIGSAFAQRFVENPLVQYIVLGVALSVLGAIFNRWTLRPADVLPDQMKPTSESEAKAATVSSSKSRFINLAIIVAFGILLLLSMLSESATLDWGQEFVRRHTDTSVGLAGVAVSIYSGAQFVGRLFGDRLAQKFGARTMVFVSGLLATTGSLLAVLSASTTPALIGFALIGLGLASIAPLMLSSAGRRDPDNVGRNVGIVNAIGYSGMLIGPAVLTILVTNFGIVSVFVLLAILMTVLAIFGPLVMKTSKPYTPPNGHQSGDAAGGRLIDKTLR